MKLVKFGALALALGLFASCNEETTEDTTMNNDTTVIVAPVAETPVIVVDTNMAPAADGEMAPEMTPEVAPAQ